MPAKQITSSPNISILDSNIKADFCAGKFFIDVLPSVFIGSGAANVKGVKVKIVNPYGVEVKPYGVAYDIAAPLTSVYSFAIPTQNRNYQYGRYQIFVKIVDADGTETELGKPVATCEPDTLNPKMAYRELGASLKGVCADGKVYVTTDGIPPYRGLLSTYSDVKLQLSLPTQSGLPVIESKITSFSAMLFEGIYRLTGTICAEYYAADHVTFAIPHKVSVEKLVRCLIDTCVVYDRLNELSKRANASCSASEREDANNITVDAIRLIKLAEFAQECGGDATEYILELEQLLNIPSGEASINNSPINTAQPLHDVRVEGVNVTRERIGLTDVYTVDNYVYTVTVDNSNGGVITVTPAALQADGITKTQTITFNIQKVYDQFKNLINTDAAQPAYWASVIKQSIKNIKNVSALGISQDQFNNMTFDQFIQALVDKINSCCNCAAIITTHAPEKQGTNVRIEWNGTGISTVDIYLDDQFQSQVAWPDRDVILYNVSNGVKRTYKLVPKCSNGTNGEVVTGDFTYLACPDITAPTVNTNNVNGVQCPFNLNSLVAMPPAGIEIEWHTANNTLPTTLVPQTSAVSDGVYYAFAKNAEGCFSQATQVQLICQAASCTAPQALGIEPVQGGFLVSFQSAQFPPPNNSYTLRRRLYKDADVSANYTTLGSPVWNSGKTRWEFLDTSAQINTEYVYVAISNCGATQPSISQEFSHYPTCPIITGLSAVIEA